ncbi:MAG TPA: glycosyltransferase [Bacteroidales bacterium]|nr:glycosyltransferase [Bacteroidales bacterium]HNR40727.1 glycosyltransferase [Bacteroidales bacterium]
MKVLFVSSGRKGVVGDVVRNQGSSLEKAGIDLDYFIIKPGIWGYIGSIPKLRKVFLKGSYDLVHAHYSLSGFVARLAGCRPLVVSLMGSDIYTSLFSRLLIRLFSRYGWDETLVKTRQMKELIGIANVHIIPNGVDIEKFKPVPKEIARQYIRYNGDKKLVVFIAGKNRPEKNLDLALNAIKLINDYNIYFQHVYNVVNDEIPYYMNAADVLLLTSYHEGSPNVIKEAMACNCPIVATDVGDVRQIIGNTRGCYISTSDPGDVADKIKKALDFNNRTNGREVINSLGLDSGTIARKIVALYSEALKSKKTS